MTTLHSPCCAGAYTATAAVAASATAATVVIIGNEQDEASFSVQQRSLYLILADCLINTAVRDGLNRLPTEFAVAHTPQRYGYMYMQCVQTMHTGAAATAHLHMNELSVLC
jgi:hypothetical protein